jgi:hypothetical protein
MTNQKAAKKIQMQFNQQLSRFRPINITDNNREGGDTQLYNTRYTVHGPELSYRRATSTLAAATAVAQRLGGRRLTSRTKTSARLQSSSLPLMQCGSCYVRQRAPAILE